MKLGIGVYSPSYPGLNGEGGIGTYTRHLARGLSEYGHRVHVLTPGEPAGSTTHDGDVAVHYCRNDYLRGADRVLPGAGATVRIGRAMQGLVTRERLDLVEFTNWGGDGLYFSRRRRVPLVVRLSTSAREAAEIDGTPMDHRLRWDVRRERWAARAADLLITHSRCHRGLMAAELGVPAERIAVVPLAVPLPPSPPERLAPTPDGAPTVVFLGRLEKRKGTLDLIRAIARIHPEFPAARFVFIGKDRPHCPGGRSHAAYIADELPESQQRQIALLGRLPDAEVDAWLARADLFVAPSLYESFGLIFLEAMRWGTPVLGTRVGGIPETVVDGESGVLVPPGDPDALAVAIVGLLRDPARRQALGAAGRRRVESEFTTDRMTERTLALYEPLVGGRR